MTEDETNQLSERIQTIAEAKHLSVEAVDALGGPKRVDDLLRIGAKRLDGLDPDTLTWTIAQIDEVESEMLPDVKFRLGFDPSKVRIIRGSNK